MLTARARLVAPALSLVMLLAATPPGSARAGSGTADAAAVDAARGGPTVAARSDAGWVPERHFAAERLALALLNCTRTGGVVRANGSCEGYGSGAFSDSRPELRLHGGISREVAFRWATAMVRADVCGHVIPGRRGLAARMAWAGFGRDATGENVGCGWGAVSVERVVVMTHRAMQAEQRSRGGHWRNIKDRDYKSVGIGVARLGGMTAVVYDFYGR